MSQSCGRNSHDSMSNQPANALDAKTEGGRKRLPVHLWLIGVLKLSRELRE